MSPAAFPQIPLIIDIALSCNKGCNKYYKLLNSKSNLINKNYLRESKWHLELNQTMSIPFWAKCRHFVTSINFDNKIKWLQYQIVRNCLKTNYVVSHFKVNVAPHCSYCNLQGSNETISHLFWFCTYVGDFIIEVEQFLNSVGLYIKFSKNKFLFGIHEEPPESPSNVILLLIKRYIWRQKFGACTLSIQELKSYLRSSIGDIKTMYEIQGQCDKFDCFNLINNLLQI